MKLSLQNFLQVKKWPLLWLDEAQQLGTLAAPPEDPDSIPGTRVAVCL